MAKVKYKKIVFLLSCVLVFLSIGFIGEAAAETYYIATNGSDSNNGSLSSPWATFNHAMSTLNAGDTLIVKAGTYNQNIVAVRSGSLGNSITIQGELSSTGERLSFINPGEVLSTGWSSYGSGVYEKALAYEPSSMVVEIAGETYDISKVCDPDTTYPWKHYCRGVLDLQFGADQTVLSGSVTVLWWEGIEAAFAYGNASGKIYMRWRDGSAPTSKGVLRVTARGATVDIGSYNYITIKDLKIKASEYGVSIAGGSNNIIDNNLIINGQMKVRTLNDTNTTISNNTMYAKSYGTYLNGSRIGFGAWGNPGGIEDAYARAVNYHMYTFDKYSTAGSNSGIDELAIDSTNSRDQTISGNIIYEVRNGISIYGSDGLEIKDNTIFDNPGIAIFLSTTNTNFIIHDNLVYNNNFFIRYGLWNSDTATGYIYNNKSWQPRNVGSHLKYHMYSGPGTISGTKSLWYYNNSFSGGYTVSDVHSELKNWIGNPMANVFYVNNIMSAYKLENNWETSVSIGACGYNWVYSATGQNWCAGGASNVYGLSQMWNTPVQHDFNISGSSAVEAGIDISQPFTVNGVTYPALPGFSPGYFDPQSKPDMGAGESTFSTQTCTSFTYAAWGECQQDNSQIRTVTSSSPSGCTGGNPVLTQECLYNPADDKIILQRPNSPVIDGKIIEYVSANSITFSPSSGGNTVTVKSLWRPDAIYLGITVTDTQLNASVTSRDGSVWDEDSIEWFIDTHNDRGGSANLSSAYMNADDYHGIVNILNAKYDSQGTTSGTPTSSWNGTWESQVKFNGTNNDNTDTDTGYTVEIKIPWTSIGYSTAPTEGTIVGLSFALTDKDASGITSIMWNDVTTAYENASKWQQVLLSGTSVVVDGVAPSPPDLK